MADDVTGTGGVAPTPAINRRLIALLAIAVIVVAVVATVLVLMNRGGQGLDLTGKWVAQDNGIVVNLTLAGTNDNLRGQFTTKASPITIDGTVRAVVTGTTAHVTLTVLGSPHRATCKVSSAKMMCSGIGPDKRLLTLTFTRP